MNPSLPNPEHHFRFVAVMDSPVWLIIVVMVLVTVAVIASGVTAL